VRGRSTRLLRTNGSWHGRVIVLESHSCIDFMVPNFSETRSGPASMRANGLVMGVGVGIEVKDRVSRHAVVPKRQLRLDSVPR
jgi:hypothetical protein